MEPDPVVVICRELADLKTFAAAGVVRPEGGNPLFLLNPESTRGQARKVLLAEGRFTPKERRALYDFIGPHLDPEEKISTPV